MNKILLGMAAASAMFVVSTASQASLMLTIDDGTNVITVDDATDYNIVNDGTVTYNSSLASLLGLTTIASGWDLVVSTGQSNPLLTANDDFGKIFSLDVEANANTAGTLTVTLEDEGFTDFGTLSAIMSGQASNGSILTESFVNFGNGWLDIGTLAITNSNESDVDIDSAATSVYDLKIVTTVTALTNGGNFEMDHTVNVPEPSVLALFGTGLLGLGLARRRMKK